jgi:hypothetical protein
MLINQISCHMRCYKQTIGAKNTSATALPTYTTYAWRVQAAAHKICVAATLRFQHHLCTLRVE